MAEMKFDTEICNFCPSCGLSFMTSQPEKNSKTNVIECGDSEMLTGCGFKFVLKSMGFEKRDDKIEDD